MIAQANYVRVRVNQVEGLPEGTAPPQKELLCIVRALLKKIKQRVLVGDFVEVSSIDWTDGRGGILGVQGGVALRLGPGHYCPA